MQKRTLRRSGLSYLRTENTEKPLLEMTPQSLYIAWDNKYETGIPILDEQARGLVSLINSFFFHRGEAVGDIYRILVPTLRMFKSYAKINFVTVERLMRESSYPKLEEYMLIHDEIIRGIELMDEKCRKKRDWQGILTYIKEYWLQTIQHHEIEYIGFLQDYYGAR